jgi:hypothetical protein
LRRCKSFLGILAGIVWPLLGVGLHFAEPIKDSDDAQTHDGNRGRANSSLPMKFLR